ncbi:autotransporter assembly complex protein TamA [Novosphingopyxis sp. YJ-S2-01]|uniref:autotransporter assembly complex protein TamA n=1 Tax=Novosphingopyxis sp. YJ-S2-01 TaxID=2794021 RepID=UPI0018DC8F65|nr:BamA/TamA family outer membrane protein [Novosphingopyxis sp. YJ-S2-01]MBH9538713.1 BamA/TamA family outer membrane protein [Novosphingopyxis sp. YJ-S2-01]
MQAGVRLWPVYDGEGAGRSIKLLLACAIATAPSALLAQQDGGASASTDSPAQQPENPSGQQPADPIISNEEFEKVVPELDPAMNGPLESMEEFTARQDALDAEEEQNRKAADADSAEALPAAQDGDANEQLADAPITDPAIDAPLPALADFQVEPVTIEGETPDDQDVEIKYAYRIEGLEPVEKAVEDNNVRDTFAELSALKDGDGTAANAAQVQARLTSDQQLMVTILESEGYYDASVTGGIELPQQAGGEATAILNVQPGERYTFGSITLDSPPIVPPDLLTSNFGLKVGNPIIAANVLAAEANLSVTAPQNGYPFFEIGQRDILLDSVPATGAYTLPITPGPRSSFGGFETSGDLAFDSEHVALLARFERGDLYDSRKTDDLRQALVATGLFNTVTVEPKQTGETAPDGTEYVTLDVVQNAGPPRTIAGSAGYGTGQGFRVEGSWQHRNLFPPEGALIAHAVAGTQEQGAGVTFRRSNAGKRDRTVELTLNALRNDFDAYNALTGRLAGRISYDSTPIWQKPLTYGYGFELVGSYEEGYNEALGAREKELYFIGALPGQVTFDQSNDLLNPTKGYRLTARLSPEVALNDGTRTYARTLLEATAYQPFGESFVLAGRVRAGAIAGIDRNDLAPSRRYYAGGGGSVRGYGYQQLGPKDPNGRPIGGRSLNEASIEGRYRFGNYGIVAFVDAGQVYESVLPKGKDLRYGVGIGGRFYTNFGPFRLDVATPINRQPGESIVSVYVSIGQAF